MMACLFGYVEIEADREIVWEMELESATPSATTCHPPRRAVLIACAAAMTNVAFGYDVGIISGSLVDIATSLRLSTIEQEMVTSGLNFVSGIGAICVSGNILDRLGRKATLLIASLLLLLGSFVVTLADSFLTLLLGRALLNLKMVFEKHKNYNLTLDKCHDTVGVAILNTSITIVFGFSILVLSNFIPTIYFGVFTGIAMLLAMLSVLTLLPRLILTFKPFGNV